MKQVIVHPERCVGCMQCMVACAAAHSQSGTLLEAVCETPLPKPRVHVGAGRYGEGFPNRCRHCDPAPCMQACLPGAIVRLPETGTVQILPERCINCASCAMACPFGVIRYHADYTAPEGRPVAVKCDNCHTRQMAGLIPACVEACKTGALVFETMTREMKRKGDAVAATLSVDAGSEQRAPGFTLLNTIKKAQTELAGRSLHGRSENHV